MAITTRTVHDKLLYQLTITSTSSDVELLRYTYATGLLSSSYLPDAAVSLLQDRWNALAEGVDSAVLQAQNTLLSHLLQITEGRGELVVQANVYSTYNALSLTELSAATTYLVHLGIPHSGSLYLRQGIG